jgi:hypothetical protein
MNSIQFIRLYKCKMLSAYVPDYVIAYVLTLPSSNAKPNSQRILGEYKMKHATAYRSFGPFPGQMQYSIPRNELGYLEIPNDPNEHAYTGRHYILTEHTAENKLRTFPATSSEEDMRKQHLILCMEHKDPNSNETWLKSAYLNHETQTVSLMTSTNRKDKLKRPIATHAQNEWFVGQYYMAAPLAFWRELKNRLMN